MGLMLALLMRRNYLLAKRAAPGERTPRKARDDTKQALARLHLSGEICGPRLASLLPEVSS
jgi:hypothetical protein